MTNEEDPELGALVEWLEDPDADPAEYTFIADGATGWVRTADLTIAPARRPRGQSRVTPLVPGEKYMTLKEAGALVRCSPETVRYWIWQGRLQAFKPGRVVLVKESELLAMVTSRETVKLRANRRSGALSET